MPSGRPHVARKGRAWAIGDASDTRREPSQGSSHMAKRRAISPFAPSLSYPCCPPLHHDARRRSNSYMQCWRVSDARISRSGSLVSASAKDNHVSAVVRASTPAASLWDASAGASSCNLEMSFRKVSRVVQRRTSRQHQLGKRVVPESVECSWLKARPRQRSPDSLEMRER